ncbi:hypothetical protein [Streptomyces sp. NPDC002573]|uniref:hypothetical protein n=1 Tax=Streptomyces sp. NPDC002573 TaxID=3364651 RepID=UPI0036CA9E11
MALKRPGFMAPPTAVSTAVAVAAALKALSEPDIQQAGSIMRDLLRPMKREDRTATASDIYHWGKDSSPFLHAVHLAALGPSMRPSHQLRYRTITAFPARPASGSQLTARRLNKVPTMFWPAWTIRLTPASGVSHSALQPTLSSALLMIGSRSERDDAAGQLGSATDKATISRILQVLRDDHCWPDIHRALDRLAGLHPHALSRRGKPRGRASRSPPCRSGPRSPQTCHDQRILLRTAPPFRPSSQTSDTALRCEPDRCGEDTLAIQIHRLEYDLGWPLLDPFENGCPLQPTGLGKQVLKALGQLNAEELNDLVKHRPGGRPAPTDEAL